MEFNPKPEHLIALEQSVAIYNQHQKARFPDYVDLTAEEYLGMLIEKQLDGLIGAINVGKEVEEAKRLQQIEYQRALTQTRMRLGINAPSNSSNP